MAPNAAKRTAAKKKLQIDVGGVPLVEGVVEQPAPPAPALPQPFVMRPVRPSMLQLASSCGYAPTLAEQHPEGSEWSTDGDARHLMLRRALETGEAPSDPALAALLDTIRTRFPEATWHCEVPVSLFDPDTDEPLFPGGTGHADIIGFLPDGRIVVVDAKFGFKPVPQPNENLQVRAYGLAKALEDGAPAFLPAIYQPNVSGFMWGRWFNAGEDYWSILDEIRAATRMRPDVPVTGPWCGDCYQVSHCKAFLLPAYEGESALEPFTREGGLTHENAPTALRVVQAMKTAIDVAEQRLRAIARERPIVDGGKQWGPTLVKNGRRSISIDAVPPELLEQLDAAGAVKTGQPFEAFRWVNVKGRDAAKKGGAHE